MKHDYKGITSVEIKTIQLRLPTPQKKLCSPVQNAPHSHSPCPQLKDLYSAVRLPGWVPVHTVTRTAACRVQSLLSIECPEYLVLNMFSCGHGVYIVNVSQNLSRSPALVRTDPNTRIIVQCTLNRLRGAVEAVRPIGGVEV